MLSPEELQRRLTGIGSSDIPEVIGVGYRDRGAIGVYLEKRQLIESIPDNEMMEWGRRLEEPIAVKAGEALQNSFAFVAISATKFMPQSLFVKNSCLTLYKSFRIIPNEYSGIHLES
mgnify:CR=1 FL=1